MHILEFVGSVIILFAGFGIYLNQIAKTKKKNRIEEKSHLYKC